MHDYVHSDRGSSFMLMELKDWLLSHNVSSSHTTPYNPIGNGQYERFNGTIWKTVCIHAILNLLETQFEAVSPDSHM